MFWRDTRTAVFSIVRNQLIYNPQSFSLVQRIFLESLSRVLLGACSSNAVNPISHSAIESDFATAVIDGVFPTSIYTLRRTNVLGSQPSQTRAASDYPRIELPWPVQLSPRPRLASQSSQPLLPSLLCVSNGSMELRSASFTSGSIAIADHVVDLHVCFLAILVLTGGDIGSHLD